MVLPIIAAGARVAVTAAARAGSSAVKAGAKTSTRNAGVVTKNTLGKAANDNVLRAANDNIRTQNAGVVMRQGKTITGDFLKRKSLHALTRRKIKDGDEEEESGRTLDNSAKNIVTPQRGLVKAVTGVDSDKALHTAAKVASLTRKGFGVSTMFWVAGFCSFWIFVFGLISLGLIAGGQYDIAFGISGDDIATFLSSPVGTVVEAGINFIGFFFGFHVDVPPVTFTSTGLAFWGLTILLNLIGFTLILGMAYISGISVTRDTGTFIMFTFCLAASLAFVTQLFPWMLVLVLFIMLKKVSPTHH